MQLYSSIPQFGAVAVHSSALNKLVAPGLPNGLTPTTIQRGGDQWAEEARHIRHKLTTEVYPQYSGERLPVGVGRSAGNDYVVFTTFDADFKNPTEPAKKPDGHYRTDTPQEHKLVQALVELVGEENVKTGQYENLVKQNPFLAIA